MSLEIQLAASKEVGDTNNAYDGVEANTFVASALIDGTTIIVAIKAKNASKRPLERSKHMLFRIS